MQGDILEEMSARKTTHVTAGVKKEENVSEEKVKLVLLRVICYWVMLLLRSSLINRSLLFASSFLSAMTHVCWRL